MNIYVIDQKYQEWYTLLEEQEGELTPELEEQLRSIELEKDAKIENIACFYKNTIAKSEAYKTEKLRLANEQAKAEKLAERLKTLLDSTMNQWNMNKFETVKCKISFRASSSINITDETLLGDKFFKIKKEVSKTSIQDALKNGEVVNGAELVKKQSIQIR